MGRTKGEGADIGAGAGGDASGAASAFWRRTPPALFPSTLGVLGLSLGWRVAAPLGAPALIADALLLLGGAFFLFAFACYASKLSARPSVLLDDLDPLPGKAAVSAGSMCLMLFAAGLHQSVGFHFTAIALWLLGVGLHIVYAACVARALILTPAAERVVTPALFLPAIGVIVAPLGGVAMGYGGLSNVLFLYSLPVGALIAALSVRGYLTRPTPIPGRAAAAILLAPTSVAASSAAALGYDDLFLAFIIASLVVAAVYALRLRWLIAGGFTPLWGAFTFPAAAFAGAIAVAAARWGGAWDFAAWASLIAATMIVVPIWALTVLSWAQGRLAKATGAAIA